MSDATWLVFLADPEGARGEPPRRPPVSLDRLFTEAEKHGVLAPVVANAETFLAGEAHAAARASAAARVNTSTGFSLMLRQRAKQVMDEVSEQQIPAIVVKGPVFADRLYPHRSLRRFTDIDLLTDPGAVERLDPILTACNFVMAEAQPASDPKEWRWIDRRRDDVSFEVHSNLVHSLGLEASLSLAYADIAEPGGREAAERPAALLLVAVMHAAGHQFERLLHIVDLCQAGRRLGGTENERDFEGLLAATGARFAAVAGLELAGRFFGDQRCLEIAKALGPVRRATAARWLISRATVATTLSESRPLYRWRRSLFRELLKNPRGRS